MDYSKTVILPQTDFPMRGELPKREPGILEFWDRIGIYRRMLEAPGKPEGTFVLHDGPPYANGNIHMGHALNKILKDMVVKSRSLLGNSTPFIPGWDCHGLPIEQQLLKEKGLDKRQVKDPVAFRKECAAFARRFIDIQREEFKRLGVLGDWENPYTTMEPAYEAAILSAFRGLVEKGYVIRRKKPVFWCIYCETALAQAEVEYKEKESHSIYVKFPVKKGWPLSDGVKEKGYILAWTTTPWTLPANMALAYKEGAVYVKLRERKSSGNGDVLILALDRLGDLKKTLPALESAEILSSQALSNDMGFSCENPLKGAESESKVLPAEFVSLQEGTGIVHSAPGHGEEDYRLGLEFGLDIFSPVDGRGNFTQEVGIPELVGKNVFRDANEAVIAILERKNLLVHRSKITHSYPHCWRCKNPVIFRATEQWFLSMDHAPHGETGSLRQRMLKEVEAKVQWIPPAAKERIRAMIGVRPDWVLSRQRLWGVPIPAFYCVGCGEVLLDTQVMKHVEDRVRREGTDFWFGDPPEKILPDAIPCKKCGGHSFEKEKDILDVWVDSGMSWLAVLKDRDQFPADIYLEGSDQHRGWFQSSLTPSVALQDKAPYKAVLTHGFVLDEEGRAMHKSLGNVVAPQKVISRWGADVLRMWAALCDYSDDVRISDKLMEVPSEAYRKIRNTWRYLLGNISDFDPSKHKVPNGELPGLERYILKELYDADQAVRMCYENYQFRGAALQILDFCNLNLSAFYLDVRKDALYTLRRDDPLRRAAQTVMRECLTRLLALSAPILSFTAEEAWASATRLSDSIFLFPCDPPPADWNNVQIAEKWQAVMDLRGAVYRGIEKMRSQKEVGGSLEARIELELSEDSFRTLGDALGTQDAGRLAQELAQVLIVSQVQIQKHEFPEVKIRGVKADGKKCARCWRYQSDVGTYPTHPLLCGRCVKVLE